MNALWRFSRSSKGRNFLSFLAHFTTYFLNLTFKFEFIIDYSGIYKGLQDKGLQRNTWVFMGLQGNKRVYNYIMSSRFLSRDSWRRGAARVNYRAIEIESE